MIDAETTTTIIRYADIQAENQQRCDRLTDVHYDPVTGKGSLQERFELALNADGTGKVYLPLSMHDEPIVQEIRHYGSVRKVAEHHNSSIKQVTKDLWDIRFKHDFEFWAITCVKIQDKESKQAVPFKLRLAQRILLNDLETMRLSGLPIRIILLKARQWGGSTLVQFYMAWIQLFHHDNWHSAIVADVEDQARNVRGMFTRMSKDYPSEVGSITLAPYEGSSKNRQIRETGAVISIGSAQEPESLRSFDLAMLHLTEVGLWKSTKQRSAEDLAQALRGALTSVPDSMCVMESTAKGVGNYFHREWLAASKGESNYRPRFIAWFEIDMYRLDDQRIIDEFGSFDTFVAGWSDYEKELFRLGATVQGIAWYRFTLRDYGGDTWRMQAEFPSTAVEAFQSTGRRVFKTSYVQNLRRFNTSPQMVGELYGDAEKGANSLKNIRFEQQKKGNFRVWKTPEQLKTDRIVKNRFCGFVDIGGRSEKADKSTLKIMDRYWMMEGGLPEIVAEYEGNLDQDLWGWYAARIGMWYNAQVGNFSEPALLAVEIQSLKEKEGEGDHSYTILDEIKHHYPNLFYRTAPGSIQDQKPTKIIGFHTNVKTKNMIINSLNAAGRASSYVERSSQTCDQMDTYEIKKDGSMGAVEGMKDDLVMSAAGTEWLSTHYMDLPVIVKPSKKTTSSPNKTEAMF